MRPIAKKLTINSRTNIKDESVETIAYALEKQKETNQKIYQIIESESKEKER
jgi:hypothetical protein